MREFLKKYGGILYIAVATVFVIVLVLSSGDVPSIVRTIKTLDARFVWAAAGCIVMYLAFRMLSIRYYLWREKADIKWHQAMRVTLIGQFYSAVTPSASGGQPMQVLTLREMNVPVSTATALMSVKFIGFQLAFLVIGGALWVVNGPFVAAQLGGTRWLVALGYMINLSLIVAIVLTVRKSKWLDRLVNGCVKLGVRLRLVRDAEKTCLKAQSTLDEYRCSVVRLLERPLDALVMFLFSCAQVILFMSVIICIYHAFRLSGHSDWQLMTLQLLLFIAAAFVPLPGAAGAQEGGFYLFFLGVFPENTMLASMLCWRFFTYYLLLLLGLVGVIADSAAGIVRKRRNEREQGNA